MTLERAVEYALSDEEFATPCASRTGLTLSRRITRPNPREKEVALLVTRGLTNRQIASELSVSEHTAATRVRRILKKLGLQSRAQIGTWVTEHRLSDSDLD
jgi:DNA-binding NarL/FixJ family response regulator